MSEMRETIWREAFSLSLRCQFNGVCHPTAQDANRIAADCADEALARFDAKFSSENTDSDS